MKPRILERLTKMLQSGPGIGLIAANPQEAIHRVHAEADGFHVERSYRTPERFGLFHKLIAVRIDGKRRQRWEQIVDGSQGRSRVFGHTL